jgi:hypothetical protein
MLRNYRRCGSGSASRRMGKSRPQIGNIDTGSHMDGFGVCQESTARWAYSEVVTLVTFCPHTERTTVPDSVVAQVVHLAGK